MNKKKCFNSPRQFYCLRFARFAAEVKYLNKETVCKMSAYEAVF